MADEFIIMTDSSSSGKNSRMLEIQVNSARLTTEQKGNFYVRISVSQDQGLRTKLVICSEDHHIPSWNQKFVFSVPRNFTSEEKSMVVFHVFKARKYLPDLGLGQANCDVKAMFPIDECMDHHHQMNSYNGGGGGGGGGKGMYDTEDDHEYNEPEIQEKETFILKASANIPILKGECEIGCLNISLSAWEDYYPYELNLNGRSKKSYPIIKDSEKVGRLSMQKASKSHEKILSFLDNVKLENLAMEFEEFLMQEKKQNPKRSALCFGY